MRWMLAGVVCGVAGLAAAAVQAQTIINPTWTQPPSPEVASALLPAFANALGISGSATIECQVIEDGHPFLCRVVSETVPGLGFGAAGRLVVASGQLSMRRVDGRPTPGTVRSNVNFMAPPITDHADTWTGRQPTPEGLRLARAFMDQAPAEAFPSVDDMMEGLDHDRRAVVRPWVEELVAPSLERAREIRAIQFARLFSEGELRGLLEGNYPDMPTEDQLLDACPEQTPEEAAASQELRRRYCGRYECGA